jgi:parallel beta-helix repeat protein
MVKPFSRIAIVSLLTIFLFSLLHVNEFSRVGSGSIKSNISVTDFGAVPNDNVDDLEGFEGAIEASIYENNVIHIPAGTYDLYGYIRLRNNNTALEGEDQNNTIIVEHRASKHNHMVNAQDINNIAIANLTLRGTGAGNSGDCIRLENVNNYTIEHVGLFDCGSGIHGAAIFANSTSNGYVINNTISASRNGYFTPNSGGSTNIVLAYNKIMNSINDAIHPQSGSDNIVLGNTVVDSGDDDIDLWNESNTHIIKNTVINSVIMKKNSTEVIDGIEIGDGSKNILTKDNKISGPLTHGINVGTTDTTGRPGPDTAINKNIYVVDNEVELILLSCIAVDDADGITIVGNRLSSCNLSDPIEIAESANSRCKDVVVNLMGTNIVCSSLGHHVRR